MPFEHESVRHSVGEYVRDMAHTNGIESFWSMLKRAHKGVYHKISAKHLQRYADEFSGRHGIRELGTLDQMQSVVAGMVGKRLIPTVIDQNPCAHLRMPRDMIFHGWSMRLFQAWQHSATMSS